MSQLQISLLVFSAVLLLVGVITGRAGQDKEEIAQRVRMVTGDGSTGQRSTDSAQKKNPFSGLSSLFRILTPNRVLAKVEADLVQADIPLKAEEMVLANLATAIIPSLFFYLLLGNEVLAVIMAVAGAYTPSLFISSARIKRLRKFNDQLGDALTIMANSLRAGFSFLQTMDSLSKELAAPISTEFARALREMRLGTTTEEALRNMADRIQSEDLELIVTAVTIQRQVGGNLAEILDNIGTTISERVRIKGEVKTLTAQGRISGTIVALLPLFLAGLISVMNPPYMALLFTHPVGLFLVGSAVIAELIGVMAIKKIVNIEL